MPYHIKPIFNQFVCIYNNSIYCPIIGFLPNKNGFRIHFARLIPDPWKLICFVRTFENDSICNNNFLANSKYFPHNMRTNFTSANAMQFNRQCQPLHFPFKMPKLPIILPCDFRASRTLTYVGSACTFQQFFFKQFGYFFLFFLFFSQMEIDLIVLQQATTEIPAVSERRSRASD